MLLGPNIEDQVKEEERLRQEEKQRRQAEEAETARKREEAEAEGRRAEAKRQDDQFFWRNLQIFGLIVLGTVTLVVIIGIIISIITRPSPADSRRSAAPASAAPQKRAEAAATSYAVSAPTYVPAPQWEDRREDRTSMKTPCAAAREEKQQAPEPRKVAPETRPYTPPPRSVPTFIQVHMPADADLYANGVLLPRQRGLSDRQFVAPACQEGSDQKYYFTVRDRNGVAQQKVVGFQAGESKSVDLGGGLVRPPPIPYRP